MLKRSLIAMALLAAACQPQQTPAPETKPADPAPEQAATDKADAAKYKPAPAGEITVKDPAANARVTSPLIAEGSAINTWFFEGQFVAELVADGEVIVQ